MKTTEELLELDAQASQTVEGRREFGDTVRDYYRNAHQGNYDRLFRVIEGLRAENDRLRNLLRSRGEHA